MLDFSCNISFSLFYCYAGPDYNPNTIICCGFIKVRVIIVLDKITASPTTPCFNTRDQSARWWHINAIFRKMPRFVHTVLLKTTALLNYEPLFDWSNRHWTYCNVNCNDHDIKDRISITKIIRKIRCGYYRTSLGYTIVCVIGTLRDDRSVWNN